MFSLRTFTLLAFFCSLASAQAAVLPGGSQLEVRLLHHVGSRGSHPGDSVTASVIFPVFDQGRLILAAGALVSGNVELIDKLGLGLRHSVARVDIHFTQLRLLDGTVTPIDARVASVETARETVSADGAILGINPTANFSTGVSIAFTLAVLDESQLRDQFLFSNSLRRVRLTPKSFSPPEKQRFCALLVTPKFPALQVSALMFPFCR